MVGNWSGRRGELAGLRYVEVTSTETADDAALVIGLHGRGSNADDLAGLAPALDPRWRYIFPQAPNRLDLGEWARSFSWYEPIMSDHERQQAARVGIPISPQLLVVREQLQQFLSAVHERFGVSPARSALIGFSQGAAMVLDTGLRAVPPYAALVAMSGFLPEADDLPAVLTSAQAGNLLVVHGVNDQVISIGISRRIRQVLERAGFAAEYREFAMGHEVRDESLAAVAEFLQARLHDAAADSPQ